ncbi:MAG: TRAP transporter small permease [Beijerinckiaceae bacterium]|nr:TRAP transporter small permease [Beijerinckiaceae bacterium]
MAALTRIVALAGGALACGIAGLVTLSVLSRWFYGLPLPGDFEMVQMGAALAVFSFLPFCQSERANIVVDTFTTRLSDRARARIDAFWDVVYAIAMGVIGYAMLAGVADAWRSGEETMVSRIPLWPALAISTGLVLLLAAVALWTAARLLRRAL